MSGDAFVIGDGLVVDERALSEIGGGDDDAAGALAVGSAGDVVGGCGGLEYRDGFDGDWRLKSSRICSAEVGMYLELVLNEARNEARSAKPSFFAMASISAWMRLISRKPSWWISSGLMWVVVRV